MRLKMRVLSVSSNNYANYPKFTAKNNRDENVHHNSKSNSLSSLQSPISI